MNYTVSMFNTGQITLPKKWRTRFNTTKFWAQETPQGLLIKPIEVEPVPEGLRDKNVELYEDIEDGEKVSGIRFEKGLGKDEIEYLVKYLNA